MTSIAFLLPGFVSKVMAWIKAFSLWLVGFGAFGIFGLTLLDSAFLPTAGAPDFALAAFAWASPEKWLLYALVAALGSTIGCCILYFAIHRAGEKVLSKIRLDRRQKIERLLRRYDMLTLIVASILPPPFPFKPFIICASAVRFDKYRLFFGLLIGRGLRYGLLAYLAKSYGEQAIEIIKHNSGWFFLGVVVLALLVWLFQRLSSAKVVVPTPTPDPVQTSCD